MPETPRPGRSIDALEDVILEGSPAVALQRLPPNNGRSALPPGRTGVIRILDIQQVLLTAPNRRRVSLLISDDEGALLAMGLIGNLVGLRSHGPYAGECLEEQVIELTDSEVYRSGQRRWFACPGSDGKPCGSRRMKLYLPPGECMFACAECHGVGVPHTPERPLRWRGESLRQLVLHWREPAELKMPQSA